MGEEINVELLGGKNIFGGREKPLEARVVKCSAFKECSLYQEGKCLDVYGYYTGASCKHGEVRRIKGYTTRAKKYYEFKNKWKSHQNYNKLESVDNILAVIKEEVYLNFTFLNIVKGEDEYIFKREAINSKPIYIPLEEFTVDLVDKIVNYKPQALMGGTITDYEEKSVPLFLHYLKVTLPELYKEYVEKHGEKEIDYVGRKAYLKTMLPSKVTYKSSMYPKFNSHWYWDGEYLIYEGGYVSSFDVINEYEDVEIRIKPSDKTIVEVESNNQVNDLTMFV